MAFSVESRTPFLDHRLVELCFSLPYTDKIGGRLDEEPAAPRARRRRAGARSSRGAASSASRPRPAPGCAARTTGARSASCCSTGARLDRGIFDRRRLERALDRLRARPGAVPRAPHRAHLDVDHARALVPPVRRRVACRERPQCAPTRGRRRRAPAARQASAQPRGRRRCGRGRRRRARWRQPRPCRPTPSTVASSRTGRRTSRPPSGGRPSRSRSRQPARRVRPGRDTRAARSP